jgi:transcriptional antiterminator RfaH
MNWYAIQTKPRQEQAATLGLQHEGITAFFPKLRRRKTIRRVKRWVTGPLFPSYIFAQFEVPAQTRLVRYSTSVINIVTFGETPAIVDDAIIAAIKEHADQDVVVLPPTPFKPGELVEIQDGPLRGLQGVFERDMSDRDRVVVLLQVLSKGSRVEVDRDQLQKVG